MAEGVDPPKIKVQPKLKPLIKIATNLRDQTQFSGQLKPFNCSIITTSDLKNNEKLDEIRSRIKLVEQGEGALVTEPSKIKK